jgi:hypothetical protein
VVFFAQSKVRLQAKPEDDAMTWRFPLILDGVEELVVIQDTVTEGDDGLTVHEGLSVRIDLTAESADEARAKATGLASLHMTALSLTTRAPVDTLELVLVYEITPGKTEDLDFAQSQNVSLPLGKVPAPGEMVSKVQQALLQMPDPTQRQPILLAAQMYASALRAIDPVPRFIFFWPASEALDRPLRRVLDRQRKDRFWGLKALAERQGESPDLIDEAYDLRNDLFHAEAGVLDDLIERTQEIGDRLEALLAAGLLLVLRVDEAIEHLPDVASSNHPTRLTFHGRLNGDPSTWVDGVDPHVDVSYETKGVGQRDKGQIESSFTLKNAVGLEAPGVELRGPFGPNLGKLKFGTGSVVREDGTVVEDVTPD